MSAAERAVRSARRRLAGQRLLDRLTVGWVVALGVSFGWLLLASGWWVPTSLLLVATLAAFLRTARDYPSRLAAALELDSRFGLKERLTAAAELSPDQRETPVGQAVAADAERNAAELRLREKFPLRLRRSAWLVPLLAGLLLPADSDTNPFAEHTTHLTKQTGDTPASPGATPPAQPKQNPFDAARPDAQRLAALRAELDQLQRQRGDDPQWNEKLTAAEDAAHALERESLDRLQRMEEQLRQLEPLAKSSEFKAGPAADAAKSLAKGDLQQAEKALQELAKNAAANPSDPQLQKQLEQLKDAVRRAGENAEAREKVEKLIEQAKKDGRDAGGLQQELDRLKSEESKPLKDLADKLEGAAQQMQQGNGAEAAKQLAEAAKAVQGIRDDAKNAQDAQAQAQRAGRMRADAGRGPPRKGGEERGQPGAGDGLSDPRPPGGVALEDPPKEVRPRVPFTDPKGTVLPGGGAGEFGGGFTPADAAKLGPAIRNAAKAASVTVAGQPLTPDDRAAVREFFERLRK
jgi:hypothetical protein